MGIDPLECQGRDAYEAMCETYETSRKNWNEVMRLLSKCYEAWAKSHVPWHEEVNALMQAYDDWLD